MSLVLGRVEDNRALAHQGGGIEGLRAVGEGGWDRPRSGEEPDLDESRSPLHHIEAAARRVESWSIAIRSRHRNAAPSVAVHLPVAIGLLEIAVI